MDTSGLKKILARTAREICQHFSPSTAATELLEHSMAPEAFLKRLLERGLYPDAVAFLAQALPNREATWWACLSARSSLGDNPNEGVRNALTAAEQWVYTPTDENRRRAMTAAESIGFDTPSAWAAVAAFWSEGSMAPPDNPTVPPAQNLNGKAVTGAVTLAAVWERPEHAEHRYQVFFEQGLDIARGGSGNNPINEHPN